MGHQTLAIYLFVFPLVALGQSGFAVLPTQRTSLLALNQARLFSGQQYDGRTMDIPLNGSCMNLNGWVQTNAGSLGIPCQAPEGQKNMCTLFNDTTCGTAMVTFDRSHYRMFDRPSNENVGRTDIGGLVQSIKCEVVDASTQVSNTNDNQSTMHLSKCANDSCSNDSDCDTVSADQYYCSQTRSNTCQRARYIANGGVCDEAIQCATAAYCTKAENGQGTCSN